MRLAKVVSFDSRVGVPRHGVALGARDAIALALRGGFLVDAEGDGAGGRLSVVLLHDGGSCHGMGRMMISSWCGCECVTFEVGRWLLEVKTALVAS